VKTSGLEWLILRCSIVLGRGGEFLRLLARLSRLPLVPVPGHGRYLLQPLLVEDLAEAVARAGERPEVWNRIYRLCGPRAFELRELLRRASRGRPRLYLPIPWPLVMVGAKLAEWLLPSPPVTTEELSMLARGSTCDPGRLEADFGLELRGVEGLLSGAAG
jgi:NADH dehydrogenase